MVREYVSDVYASEHVHSEMTPPLGNPTVLCNFLTENLTVWQIILRYERQRISYINIAFFPSDVSI